ncbi:MAG: DUF4389 domain-containing protein [Pseudomonadota bacterium]|jgi:hypothetical protein|nr:DUF4389 domain-containing protein [Pseudomonadota bacterium]
MNDEIKQKILDTNTWLRGLFMLLFFLIAGVARFVIAVVVLFQFLSVLFTGNTNAQLLTLGQSLSTYIYQITLFLTFNSEQRPFPFSNWPDGPPRHP